MGELRGVLRFENAAHIFDPGRRVGPLNLEVGPGHILGIVGSNGSGKTTALRMATALLPVHQGAILHGREPVRYGRMPDGMAALIENPAFLASLTGEENLVLAAAGRRDRLERIEHVLRTVDIWAVRQHPVREYSQGMRQRLGIARVLLPQPQTLLLDEPSNGLDPLGIRWLRASVKDLASQGKTVVMSSHLLHEVQQVASHVAVLSTGQLVSMGPCDDVTGGYASLEDLYFDLVQGS